MNNEPTISWGRHMSPDLLSRWPKDESGAPEEPVFLCSVRSTDLSDTLLVNMLEAYGIPCLCTERGDGSFGRVMLGISGYGVDLYVPKSCYNDAKLLCEGDAEHEEL